MNDINGTPVSPEQALDESERQGLLNKATGIKLLGGFGCRVHYQDLDFATKINELLNGIASINAEDVECAMVMFKVRRVGATPQEDKFALVGGNYGTEPELSAIHMIMASDLQIFRSAIAKKVVEIANAAQGGKDEVQDEASDS